MISFITLSREKGNVETLEESIHHALASITPWEMVVVDGNKYDICSGYNHGARRAKGDILAFTHDDVLLLGNRLTLQKPLDLLANPATGFLGVAGSRIVTKEVCWWKCRGACRGMVIHPDPQQCFGIHYNFWPWTGDDNSPSPCGLFGPVAVLDGVLLMCTRRVYDRLGGFDQQSYQGFHFYDIDITFRAVLDGLTNYAMPIPIFHLSPGRTEEENWEKNRQIFLAKFGQYLPYQIS